MRPFRFLAAAMALFITASFQARAADPRADFLKLIDRPRVDPAFAIESTTVTRGNAEIRFSYAAQAGSRIEGIILKSEKASGKRPAVIALHGTGGSKTSELPMMRRLAAVGIVAISIDGPYHGARAKEGKASYENAILKAYRAGSEPHEHPFFFDTVWDVMRLVDVLEMRDDIDPARIGLYGVSKGGIETYLTAALDPRIAAAVPCIGVESFRWADENNSWQSRIGTIQKAFDLAAKDAGVEKPDGKFVAAFYAKVAPGIDGEFDGPSMVPLIAPRPLMTINGEIDPRTPAPGLKLATDATAAAYKAANAEDHFLIRIQPNTPHRVNLESYAAAAEWFVKWLKPEPLTP